MSITMIAAVDQNNGIGLNSKLPWHVPANLAHFKRTALGKWLVAGRKTADTLPEWARDGGKLFTLTRDKRARVNYTVEGIVTLAKTDDMFVVGGAQIYAAFLPHASKIVLTVIHERYTVDRYFPMIISGREAQRDWKWTGIAHRATCAKSGAMYSIWELTRQTQENL